MSKKNLEILKSSLSKYNLRKNHRKSISSRLKRILNRRWKRSKVKNCQLRLPKTTKSRRFLKKVNFILKDLEKKRPSWENSILSCSRSNWDRKGTSSLILNLFSKAKLKKNCFRRKLTVIRRNRRLTIIIKRNY